MHKKHKKTKNEGLSSLLGLTSILDYIDEKGKVTDKEGLIDYIENESWEQHEMVELVSSSPEARKIVRNAMESKYKDQLKNKPDAWFTRMNKKEVDKLTAKGEDPFDYWYAFATNKDRSLEKNNFLNGILLLYRMFFGSF